MTRKSILLLLALFLLVNLIKTDFASASLLPLTESGLNSARTRTQEREIQNLKNQVNQNNYSNPTKSTTDLIMEMSQQNAANEKLKEEIKAEMNTKTQKVQAINCSESLGENSKYNSESKKCECIEEYKLYKNKCISKSEYKNEYCKETSGIDSRYDNENDKCLTNEDYCKEKMGYGARYSIGNEQCECTNEFVLNNNICVEEKKEEEVKTEARSNSFSGRIISFFQKLKFW